VEKHKAISMSIGFSQVEGIDYDEIFSPLSRYSSVISILALLVQKGWKIHQMEVWKYGKEMRNYLSLKESMPTRC